MVGMRLAPDPKANGQTADDKDFLSNDPQIRAAKPMVAEITIGYPQ
jgi:hypothetical protein